MLVTPPPTAELPTRERPNATAAVDQRARSFRLVSGGNGLLDRQYSQIVFGDHIYPLRKPERGSIEFDFDPNNPKYRFALDRARFVVGEGETPRAAIDSFHEGFHARFQELYVKRPFEWGEPDRSDWYTLLDLVDVAAYRESQPVIVRRYGLVFADQGRRSVQWEGLTAREPIDLGRAFADFVRFKTGQYIEALVEIDPGTNATKRITWAVESPNPELITDKAAIEFWSSLPGMTTSGAE